jgi:hypothetical protein
MIRIVSGLWVVACVFALVTVEQAGTPESQSPQNAAEYNAEVPKTIIELQQFRQTSSIKLRSGSGNTGTATMVNLNPAINAWYLLSVIWKEGTPETSWHLENPRPRETKVFLEQKSFGLVIAEGNARYSCDLFGTGAASNALEQGIGSQLIYYPLCGGRLYLRNPAKGARTALEAATEFLRDQVWGGEKVIILFHHLLADRYRDTTESANRNQAVKGPAGAATAGYPLPALIDPAHGTPVAVPETLGIAFEPESSIRNDMAPGAWYPAAGNAGVYVSIVEPGFIAPAILAGYRNIVSNPDKVELSSLCYLIAFDMDRFEVGYSRGTGYPGVEWSDRVTGSMKITALPGPDGIGSVAPLVSTGLIDPEIGRRTVATFTGGFKRSHGAFRYGDLSLKNHGSHYGFIENGVVFSKLQPGLATLFVLDDGSIGMKTWLESDNSFLARIRHARQNGVPLAEFDDVTQSTVPGRLVARWGPGNWSGSEDDHLRTIRGGAALQVSHGKRFLIYAVFSDATPSAMARVFQAYRCNYAMLLDMNALEHTYLAYYRRSGSEMSVDHLIKGMSQLDQSVSGQIIPRFLGYPDNRDFFYVMHRNAKEVKR